MHENWGTVVVRSQRVTRTALAAGTNEKGRLTCQGEAGLLRGRVRKPLSGQRHSRPGTGRVQLDLAGGLQLAQEFVYPRLAEP